MHNKGEEVISGVVSGGGGNGHADTMSREVYPIVPVVKEDHELGVQVVLFTVALSTVEANVCGNPAVSKLVPLVPCVEELCEVLLRSG